MDRTGGVFPARPGAGLSHGKRTPRVSRIPTLAWAMAALAAAGAFASLGFWQSDRAGQKQRWLDGYAAALLAEPVAVSQALAAPSQNLPVRVAGTFRLQPRPLLFLDGQQRDGRVGVRAYVLADSDASAAPLLVELGWLPFGPGRSLPRIELPHVRFDLDGLLLPWPAQGLRLGENRWDDAAPAQLLAYLDRDEIARATGLRPYDGVLRPDPGFDLGGAVRDVAALPNTLTPDQHRGYALQWWGLAATVVSIYLVLALRRSMQ